MPPSIPMGVTATATSSSRVDLTWFPSTDATGVASYHVFRNGMLVVVRATTSYSDSNVTASTRYCYSVSAVDRASNESPRSLESCVTTPAAPPPPDSTAPSPPTSLLATAVSTSQINLLWAPAYDAVGIANYDVYRDGLLVKSTPFTSMSDFGLGSSTRYCYVVRAVDAAGNRSLPSAEACAQTASPPDTTPPSTPYLVVARFVPPNSADVSWAPSTDAGGIRTYHVYANGILTHVTSLTSCYDTFLAEATRYCYAVSAVDWAGNESPRSLESCITTADVTRPSTPPYPIASATSSSRISVSWGPSIDNVGVTNYWVYRDGLPWQQTSLTFANDFGLLPNTRHCYSIRALDAAGNESFPSLSACATTFAY